MLRWLVFWILLTPCGLAVGQDATTGAVHGVVHDAAGAMVPGARVTVSGVLREAISRRDGSFDVPLLAPGEYTLVVHTKGFAAKRVSVTVTLGETAQLEVQLRIATSASVQVHAEPMAAPALQLDDAAAALSFQPDAMSALPLYGRRWQSFARLAPMTSIEGAAENEVSFGGMPLTQNSYTLDGADATRSFTGEPRGGSRSPGRVAMSAVREFRVLPAERGAMLHGGAGGTVVTVTHAATSAPHGSAFVQYRSAALAAREPFAIATRYNNGAPTSTVVKPGDTRWQWGGRWSGPVPKAQRTFALAAYEQQRRSFPAYASTSNSAFFNLTATQTALLQNRGVTLPKIGEALQFLDSLMGPMARRGDHVTGLARVEWRPDARDVYSVAWNGAEWKSPNGTRRQTVVDRAVTGLGLDAVRTDDVTLHWSRGERHGVLQQLNVVLSRDHGWQEATAPLPQEPHSGPHGFSPQVSIQGEFTFGKPSTLGRRRYPDERRAEVLDTVAWTHGRLLAEGGVSASWIAQHIDTLSNEEGSYVYSSQVGSGHAGGLVDWITDYTFNSNAYPNGACPAIYAAAHYFCFQSFTQGFGRNATNWSVTESSIFAQARWRVREDLSVEAGIRYELATMPAAQRANAGLDATFGDFAATSTLPHDRDNVAPRVAVAWSPWRRLSVRGGYGIYYGRVPGAMVWSALTNTAQAASTYRLRISPKTIVDASCASYGTNFGYPATYACQPAGVAATTTSAVMFARNFQWPLVQRASLQVQAEVLGVVWSASYVGMAAQHLAKTTDVNISPTTQTTIFRVTRTDNGGEPGLRNGDNFAVPLYTQRVNASYGVVTAIVSNANAAQHALVVTARKPMRYGVSGYAAWTYGKLMDDGVNAAALPDEDNQFDPYEKGYDRAVAAYDRRHRIAATMMLQPHVRGDRMAHALLNHWEMTATATVTSGRPYSYLITGGTELNGGRASINGSGGARYLPSVGRDTLRMPWQSKVDVRVTRSLGEWRGYAVRVYAECFNVLNSRATTGVQQRAFLVGNTAGGVTQLVYQDAATITAEGLNVQPFGTYRDTGESLVQQRAVQFGLKFDF